jgi:ATP-independent RNA helicase DbpA
MNRLTAIQEKSLPLLMAGQDLIGQSQTGSGKTAAFCLPILDRLQLANVRLHALILCPTRELCAQVARELRRLGRHMPGLHVLTLVGGEPLGPQRDRLEKGVHIAVGTPGRVLDHITKGTLELESLRTLVLDEADRMLDMGFQDEMEAILKAAPRNRQTVFFSATYPETIESLSQRFQSKAHRITIEAAQSEESPIRELCYRVSEEEKPLSLLRLLERHQPAQALIFCNQKLTTNALKLALARAGTSVGAIHGDLEQCDRDRVMAQFRNQSLRFLIATDVAARGIDVAALDAVFNYDVPPKADVYTHRIGRTGRAGLSGLAITMISERDTYRAKQIQETNGKPWEEAKLGAGSASHRGPVYAPPPMVTLAISGGRKDKLRAGDILGACTGESGGLEARQVGKIEIHDHCSYLAIAQSSAHQALERLRDGRIKARKFTVAFVSH